jgi:hypothetical protein
MSGSSAKAPLTKEEREIQEARDKLKVRLSLFRRRAASPLHD